MNRKPAGSDDMNIFCEVIQSSLFQDMPGSRQLSYRALRQEISVQGQVSFSHSQILPDRPR